MTDIATPSKPLDMSSTLIPSVLAGLVIGFIHVITSLSLATLLFSGPLVSELPRGIGLALITTVIQVLFATCFASFDGVIGVFQDNPTILIAVSVASLETLNLGAALLPTVIALIMTTTLLTGGFLLLLGYFKLGGLVRYIPYPVIGGFLAGSGWLMIRESFGTMTAYSLTNETISTLLMPNQVMLWLPGIAIGVGLVIGVRLIRSKLALPILLVAILVIFYAVMIISGTSVDEATRRGFLLGQVATGGVWHPLPIGDMAQADWGAVLGQIGNIGAVMALVAMSLLLNISGLELIIQQDIDLNREIQNVGLANIVSGLAGGAAGYYSLSQSTLRYRMGARGRLAGFVAAAFSLVILFVGSSIVAYIPKPLLGGLIIFMGIEFLIRGMLQSRRNLRPVDYAVVIIIFVVIAAAGFLAGVGVGLVLMIVLFVVNYSRLNVFHRMASGAEITSHVERSAYHQRTLTELGKRVYLLELQGFIFFGTANSILERVRQRVTDTAEKPPVFVLLDFRRVIGLDSSAVFSLTKLKNLAELHKLTLIFTNLTSFDQAEFMRGGLAASDQIRYFEDLDHGLEWCEDQLLELSQVTKTHFPTTLALQLADSGFKKEDTKRLQTYLQRMQFKPGEYLMRQGNEASELIFVEIGQVSVYLELPDDKRVRLHTHSMGTIVGELGFFLNAPRSASVISDLNTIAYSLNAESFKAMTEKDPALAVAFQTLIIRLLSERLIASTSELAALNR